MESTGHRRRSSSSRRHRPKPSTSVELPSTDLGPLVGVHKTQRVRYAEGNADEEGDNRRAPEPVLPIDESLTPTEPQHVLAAMVATPPPGSSDNGAPITPTTTSTTTTTTSSTRRKHKHKEKHHKSRRESSRSKSRSSTDEPAKMAPMAPTEEVVVAEGSDAPTPVDDLDQRAAALTVSPLVFQHREPLKTPVNSELAPQHHSKKQPVPMEQLWKTMRSPLRESQEKGLPRPGIVGVLHRRTPPPSSPPTPRPVTRSPLDLRRLAGCLDLTSPGDRGVAGVGTNSTPRHDHSSPRLSPPDKAAYPFELPPDVGTGFLLEPSAGSSSRAPEQRKFTLTRTRSLPDLRQATVAPDFLRNRMVLQTDDTVYLPYILRKEYVIRTKLRVSFSLLKPRVPRRSRSLGHVTEVTFLQQHYCNLWKDSESDFEDTEWQVDEGCNFFDLCSFRIKCCKKRVHRVSCH